MSEMKKERILYLDLLKIISSFCVIMIHVTAENWYQPNIDFYWIVNNSYNALIRWAVPVFVMVSGALILPKEIPFKPLYTKYILRILLLLFIWGEYYWLYSSKTWSVQNFVGSFCKLLNGQAYSHLWYLYMLIGLYLITPIVQTFIKNAERRMIEYLLIFLFICQVLLPYVFQLVPQLSGFYQSLFIGSFSKYLIYYAAGYYLSHYGLSYFKRMFLYCTAILFLFGSMIYSDIISYRQGEPAVTYGLLSIGTFLASFAIFVFGKHLEPYIVRFTFLKRSIRLIGPLTFGIYLLHFRIEKLFLGFGIHSNSIHPLLGVPLVTCLIFTVTALCVFLLSKIPLIRKLVQ